MGGANIEITTSEGFAPSDRLRAALDELAVVAAAGAEAEVEGFGAKLTVGDVGFKASIRPDAARWSDGCWGYSEDGGSGSCGWYQEMGESCLGFSWSQ